MSVAPFSVELATAALMIAVPVRDFLSPRGKRSVWAVYLAGTAALLALAVLSRGEGSLFGGAYVADGLSWFAKLLILLGMGFKLSMVPMHVWAPDVYEGAPTPVTAFISVASKSAGFVFLIRLFFGAILDFRALWVPLLIVTAVLTMTVGNLAAIPQRNVKRLLAYSTISQAGYILVGFVGAPAAALRAVLFYLLVHTFTNMAAFTAVIAFSSATGSDRLEDYAGLARRQPLLALAFTLALLSLAGIPPLGGFVGKIDLFYAAMKQGYLWLVIVAGLNSIVSLYYYLLVLKRMYIEEGAAAAARITLSFPVKAVLVFTIVGILALGLASGPVLSLEEGIFRTRLPPPSWSGGSGTIRRDSGRPAVPWAASRPATATPRWSWPPCPRCP